MKKIKRIHSNAFKAKVALEAIKNNKTLAQLASDFNIVPSRINAWRKHLLDNLSNLFDKNTSDNNHTNQKEMHNLYALIGKLKAENDFLKKSLL